MTPKIERVLPNDFLLGEGPHWDAESQALYFVDIFRQNIHKYVPSTKKHTKANIGKHISFIIPVKGKKDHFVITTEREVVLIIWDGETDNVSIVKKLYEVDENTNNVLNDGKCDPSGRLWAGTMAPQENDDFPDEKASLYTFQNNIKSKQLSKIGLSNGIAFDPKAKKLYYNDSLKGTLDQFEFDITTGTISNGKPIFTLNEKRGLREDFRLLDGMTIDTDGNLWVAVCGDHRVIKIDPRKPETIIETIQLPALEVTSVAFGGANLDELYVTTGNIALKGPAPNSPDDGAVLKITGLNAKGLPGDSIVL